MREYHNEDLNATVHDACYFVLFRITLRYESGLECS